MCDEETRRLSITAEEEGEADFEEEGYMIKVRRELFSVQKRKEVIQERL